MNQFAPTPVVARFTFHADRAAEFLEDGRLVTQIDCDSIEEVMEYLTQFDSAIADCNVIVNGKTVNLVDFPAEGK